MSVKLVLWSLLGIAVLGLIGFGGWLITLPPAPARAAAPPIAEEEIAATVEALKPPKRERPVVAIIGINDATETTDYLLPYGILKRADVADVTLVATGPGPVKLFPALTVEPDMTVAAFEEKYPEGADYVIVPAMSRDDDPAALAFIRGQSEKGATVIGVCAGAKVVGEARLLDGKRGTTHWFYLGEFRERSGVDYVADRRIVVDGNVATTTGITASMPMMLTLIEAIAGREKAQAVATDLGLPRWDARHASSAFTFTRPFATTVMGNLFAFWRRETFGIPLRPGMDEASLGLVADAWSRTYRSSAVTFAGSGEAVETRNGLRVVPDKVAADWPEGELAPSPLDRRPAEALDAALQAINSRYGLSTGDVVAMQLEYPR
jgi:putative intracellular protease/amidase